MQEQRKPVRRGAKKKIELLAEQLKIKKRMVAGTFRYQPSELDKLEMVAKEINAKSLDKISKNDVVRLALNALLDDYEYNGDASTLAQVVAQMQA